MRYILSIPDELNRFIENISWSKRTVSSINNVGKTGHPHAKEQNKTPIM